MRLTLALIVKRFLIILATFFTWQRLPEKPFLHLHENPLFWWESLHQPFTPHGLGLHGCFWNWNVNQ